MDNLEDRPVTKDSSEWPPFDPSMLQTADSRFLWNLRKANKLNFYKLSKICGLSYSWLLAIEEDRYPMTDEDREKILSGIKAFNLEKKKKALEAHSIAS